MIAYGAREAAASMFVFCNFSGIYNILFLLPAHEHLSMGQPCTNYSWEVASYYI